MKRVLQFALAAMMFLAACSKEDETPPSLIQEQEVQEATTVVENAADDGYITLEEARKDLESILADFTTLSKSGNGGFPARKIADGFTLKSTRPSLSKSTGVADTAKIHVFNFEDNSGFAIMSATTEMPSLLAITEGGNIDTNEVIEDPGLTMFLANLEVQCALDYNRRNPGPDDNTSSSSTSNTSQNTESNKSPKPFTYKYESVYSNKFYNPRGGYCKVHWHQNDPFNIYCLNDKDSLAPVGCVAVACAQLMSIYKYPKSYNGRVLHWDEMIVNYDSDDIAWLMRQLGNTENLDMSYGSIEKGISSGAYPGNVPRTLKHFGYSNGGTLIRYNDNQVCAELKNHYPVLLGGYSFKTSKSGTESSYFGLQCSAYSVSEGHKWLAHGLLVRTETRYKYKVIDESLLKRSILVSTTVIDRNYILCNFGWGQKSWDHGYYLNGYYYSGVFDTNAMGEFSEYEPVSKSGTMGYYQYDMDAVINIRK